MSPIELVRQHLGDAEWQVCRKAWAESAILRQVDDLSPFRAFEIYRVQGATHQFDFPMLPHCSFGLYAANGFKAIRLTRANKEIELVLAEVWSSLAECDPVILASLVLMFYDGGIQRTHRVLADENPAHVAPSNGGTGVACCQDPMELKWEHDTASRSDTKSSTV